MLAVLTAIKIIVAARLDLFGDEAFYWQCAQRLAPAYVDHPPLTAFLVWLGTGVFGDTTLGVRVAFLLCGFLLPPVVLLLSHSLVGARDAWWAAGATVVVLPFAALGTLAIPDTPLLLLTALFLYAFSRAVGEYGLRYWFLTGVVGALGLLTHYRFTLAILAALVYLALSWNRRPSPLRRVSVVLPFWLAGALPSVHYNLQRGFAPIRYYLAGRHDPGGFDPLAWLDHLARQAAVMSPLFYLALVGVLVGLVRRAWGGDDRAILAATFSIIHLGLFFLLSPFEEGGMVVELWPLPGYLALLPFLPGAVRRFANGKKWRRCLAGVGAAMATLTTLAVLVELGTGWLRIPSLREPFVGWSEVTSRAEAALGEIEPAAGDRRIVVADHYKLAAHLDFALRARSDVYVLDHRKNRKHGRAEQFREWRIDPSALALRAGEDALVVVEISEIRRDERQIWLSYVGSFFAELKPLEEITVDRPGKRKKVKVYGLYRGRGVRDRPGEAGL